MISGLVTDEGEPVVFISIAGENWRAVIDTGFTGDLELPNRLKDQVDPVYQGTVVSLLAGGQSITEESFALDFPFDGRFVKAEATFVNGNEILIGTHLLRNYRLQIDFVDRRLTFSRVR